MKVDIDRKVLERFARRSLRRQWALSLLFFAVCAVLLASLSVEADDKNTEVGPKADVEQQKQALAEFNKLIGEWRGIGMPRRGSRAGAWSEKAEWVWNFDKNSVAVDYKVAKGKLLQTARVTFDPTQKTYLLAGTFADKTRRSYEGRLNGKKLLFVSEPDDKGYVHLITVTGLNEKRSLVLYQKRRQNSRFLSRVAEVGYTRAGTSLAVEGAGEIECIVTGGKGTMPVTYKGKTYYVCCSGCKTAFDDDPEGVIADYKRKLAERKKKAAKAG